MASGHTEPHWALVCLRQLEEKVPLGADVEELSLSHDRCFLALQHSSGQVSCYSCDNGKSAFRLNTPIVEDVQQTLWTHLAAEKTIVLHANKLTESPGVPCLVSFHAKSCELSFSRFFGIDRPDVSHVRERGSLADGRARLEAREPLIEWGGGRQILEDLPQNTICCHTVSLIDVLKPFPECSFVFEGPAADAADEDDDGSELKQSHATPHRSRKIQVRLSVAQPSVLVLFIDDAIAMALQLTWRGASVTHCFFLRQQPQVSLVGQPAAAPAGAGVATAAAGGGGAPVEMPLRISDITACQEWIFAVTAPPDVHLLIWYITGVAFHAIPLGDYLESGVRLVSLVVALDLLGVALCDNEHNVWILSLDRYFDASPKGLDWELLRERQRCADGVPVLSQMSKDYQDLSAFPEAFGLQLHGQERRGRDMKSGKMTLMDCLVEGVPTYGILIPGGAVGVQDHLLGRDRLDSIGVDAHATENDGGMFTTESATSRCIPYAWHERIHQTQEWLDLDRRWTVDRTEKVDAPAGALVPPGRAGRQDLRGGVQRSRGGDASGVAANLLNGFSVPAQNRLGDDDFHYSLYAALQKHARRQFQSRLPPWLMRVEIPRRPHRVNPPMLGTLSDPGGDEESSDSELALRQQDSDTEGSSPRRAEPLADGESGSERGGRHPHSEFVGSKPVRGKRQVPVGNVKLSMTSSYVFCDIWEAVPDQHGTRPLSPWGLCVIPRPGATQRSTASRNAPVDYLTGSSLEALAEEKEAVQKVVTFRSSKPWRTLMTQNHIWYMLSEGMNLCMLLMNQSPVRIISNLLVFENHSKASKLCALNGWNATQLPVLTLFLGLRFRELDEIQQSLGLLRPDQEMEACQMIMGFIHAGYSCASLTPPFSPSPPGLWLAKSAPRGETSPSASTLQSDRSFVSRLLEIALQFVTKLIQTRVMQIQECEGACRALTYLQPEHSASEAPKFSSMVHELSQLTVHMQSLRALQQKLIASMGEEKAYDAGITIQCPAQDNKAELAKLSQAKSGMTTLDAAISLAAKIQAGSESRNSAAALADGSREAGAAPWCAESTEAVVRGALISGRVSSALNWFHEAAQEEGTLQTNGTGSRRRVFENFRITTGRLAYNLLCNQQIDFLFMAMHMLRHVGENINKFFKAVAFHTSKRVVRRKLLKHLNHMRRLSKEDKCLISLVNLLERLYTNPCYTTEFNRMTTCLAVGQYPRQAHDRSTPAHYTWPAGGHDMLQTGLNCDGVIGSHIRVDTSSGKQAFDQQTSVRDLPVFQRMPLELFDSWGGYQAPMMQAFVDSSPDALRAWGNLPCGDIEDLDAHPVLGLANFHKASNLEGEQELSVIAEMREVEGMSGDSETLFGSVSVQALARSTCRQCRLQSKDESDAKGGHEHDEFTQALGLEDPYAMGYLHVTLSWMKQSSWQTRARIIMEKTHFQPHLLECLPWLQPPADGPTPAQAWRHCWLDFLVAHQDWRGLAAWVRRMPLRQGDRVDSYGKSSVDLSHLEARGLPYCTSYAKEVLLQELGQRGIFCRHDVSSFYSLLRRLARCGRLFSSVHTSPEAGDSKVVRDDDALEEGALPLDRLLPRGEVCTFHQFFIHFCIDHDLPTLMLLYLQNYDLAATMQDLKALQLRHASKPWASLLLVGRLGNSHLFAASLLNASILSSAGAKGEGASAAAVDSSLKDGKHQAWHDAEKVVFLSLNDLATHSPLCFLASLMFAPVASVVEAASAPRSAPWFVDVARFKEVVLQYPTLSEVFFPENGTPVLPLAVANAKDDDDVILDMHLSPVERVSQAAASRLQAKAGNTEGSNQLTATAAEEPQRPLDDMATFKADVTLFELLADVAAFDVQKVLKPLPIFVSQQDDGVKLQKDVREAEKLTALVAKEETFQDELGEGYFLAQGRAMMAFHVLLTKCVGSSTLPGGNRLPLTLQPDHARRLHGVAKSVALHNLLNEGVVSSTVCLLELCSLETEMLRVDVQAAKRIYEHQVRAGPAGGGSDRARAAAASVIELFLSFPDVEVLKEQDDGLGRAQEAAINSGHLLTALRMLEESTWALDPHPSAPTVSSLQALAYDSPWHLVALFCRVHSLPRSLTLLHELARNNDWVMFLHESDLQQCPADTVLDVVDGYFTDMSLQSHLRILAHSIAAQAKDDRHSRQLVLTAAEAENNGERMREQIGAKTEEQATLQPQPQVPQGKLRPEAEARPVVDAIDFLEQCRGKLPGAVLQGRGTGASLLRYALSTRTARLAVVASAFSEVTPLQCMAVWLTVNTQRSQGMTSEVASRVAPLTEPSPAEVASQIASLCRKSHAFSLVLRALKIFDPANPLVDFVKFHRAFVQSRFQTCTEHLIRFVQRREAESRGDAPSQEPHCLGMVPHVTSLSDEIVQHLLDAMPRSRLLLLSALDQANFSPYYSHLYRSFRLIQSSGLSVDFRIPASELLQLLISKKMFAEAREWAKSSGIVGDTIVFEEVTGMIVEFRQGVWWNVLDERLRLWHKCYDAFLRQNYPPLGAANFFLDITSKLEPDLFAREQLMLLCIAFELLGTASEGEPSEQLAEQRPQLSMLLILTGTNKDLAAELDFSPLDLSYGTLRSLVHRIPESVSALPLYHEGGGGGSSSWGVGSNSQVHERGTPLSASLPPLAATEQQKGPRTELLRYLETATSSLINCDEIGWAQRLAAGFSFESRDLRLAEALAMVASGRLEEAFEGLQPDDLPDSGLRQAADKGGDVENVLKGISAQCSGRIELFCRRCRVFYAVSRTIGMDYGEVTQVDITELLDRLLSPQPLGADISLCKSLLACCPKPPSKASLASILAQRFIRSLISFGSCEWPEDKIIEFVSVMGSSEELVGNASLSLIPTFREFSMSATTWLLSEASHPGAWAPEEQVDLPYDCEVEVLVMAYHAYVQGCHERSIEELLRFLRERVEVYMQRGLFRLLLRLLQAIPEYHAMEYMFGHLMQRGQLDCLLDQGRLQGHVHRPGLAVALVRYLHHHYPRNLELLVKVYLCFGLEGQLADLLERKAEQLVQNLGRKWEHICSTDGEEQLLMCLSLFLQCSKFFLRAGRFQKHLVANELSALICLQLKAVQIHLAASLQEQQAAMRSTEGNILDSVVGVGLGHVCELGLDSLLPGFVGVESAAQDLAASAAPTTPPGKAAANLDALLGTPSTVNEDPDLLMMGDTTDGVIFPSGGGFTSEVGSSGDARAGENGRSESGPHALERDGLLPAGRAVGMAPGATAGFTSSEEVMSLSDSKAGKRSHNAPPLGSAGDPFVVINLEAEEVEVFMEYHHDFVVAFQVVSAYRHFYSEHLHNAWPRALYRQVVLLGNVSYLQVLLMHMPLTKEHLEATVQLYLHEPCPEQFPARAMWMKQFLRDGVPNLEIRYQLARQLGAEFVDISMETASLVYMA